MTYYVPGSEEKDPAKVIMSLQQAHTKTATNTTDIAANTANIATNTTNIATNTANIATNTAAIAAITVPSAATKVNQQAATSNTVFVAPLHQQDHPSAAKAWAYATLSAGVVTNAASYGITSIVRNSAGNFTITMSTAMSSSNYVIVPAHRSSSGHADVDDIYTITGASTFTFVHFEAAAATDPDCFSFVVFGTQ